MERFDYSTIKALAKERGSRVTDLLALSLADRRGGEGR